ncbi:MAG: hypothetical protein R3345_13755 [Fulvivirga sp.]|nr:hypothetical protein [Fulvivirga sp.]
MFDKIKDKIEQYAQEVLARQQATAKQFDDPIAENTGWTPIKPGGSNFKSQELKLTPQNQLKVVKSKAGKAFYLIFAVVGLGVMIAAFNTSTGTEDDTLRLLMMVGFGAIFFLVGTVPLFKAGKLYIFDKSAGYCWTGKTHPRDIVRAEEMDKMIKLDRIKGLQILSERISGSKGRSYRSYELNLILDDHERVNVMDHGNYSSIQKDAKTLSDYLEVPVFDGA